MQGRPTPSTRSSAPRSACEPLLHVAQPYGADFADAACALAKVAGIDPLPWQRELLADWSAHVKRPGGIDFVHRRCGGSVPRQSGKSVDGIVWCLFLVVALGYRVLWTDHNYSTTTEMLRRFQDILGKRPRDPMAKCRAFNDKVASVNNKTAQEGFFLSNGGILCFSTRTKQTGLGFSFDVVVYDEAQELTDEHVQALMPVTTSGPHRNPQAIYLGTPTRAGSHARVFSDIHAEAHADPAPDLCWVEYGVDEVGDVRDESRWPLANPSLGTLATLDAIRIGARGMSDLAFAQEYLGYWLPRVSDALVSQAEWAKLSIGEEEAAAIDGARAFGVKFSPDGESVAVAVAVRPGGRGAPHVELASLAPTSRGTRWLAEWLFERSGSAKCAAIDGLSGAGQLRERLAGMGSPRGYCVAPRAADVTTAAAMMLEAIKTESMTHLDDPALELSATASTRRAIGSNGGWGWGGTDAAPIEAASLALWALRTCKRDPSRIQEASF